MLKHILFTCLLSFSVTPLLKAQNCGNDEIYHLPYKNTYVKEPLVTENEYRVAKPEVIEPKSFEEARQILPSPIWDGHGKEMEMYWRAWEIAVGNIRKPQSGSGFVSSYLDTAYNGNIFMWDSSFILMFARYGTRFFPFQRTLDNFYAKQHPDGFICREIKADGADCFERYDPVSTGPNLMPWCEMVYYHQFGDMERLHKVFPVLCSYYKWLRLNRTWRNGTYWSSGWGTGMDNMPRVPNGYSPIYSHGHMVWLDTNLQQLFIANLLLEMGFYLERWQEIEEFEDEAKMLGKYIHDNLWDEKTGFLLQKSPYYVGTKGPGDVMGCGNCVIPIFDSMTKKKVESVLYCIDSNDYQPDKLYGVYDWIHFDQIAWYRKQSAHFASCNNGRPLPSLAFFHIPLLEYNELIGDGKTFGNDREGGVASSKVNSGIFASFLDRKDVMGVFAGHDHDNDYVGINKRILLGYGRVTGADAYGELIRGARIIELYEGEFKFDTWIATLSGREAIYYYPSGLNSDEERVMNYFPAMNVASPKQGVAYTYYEGQCKRVADITSCLKVKKGIMKNFLIKDAAIADHFAYEFRTLIYISKRGVYRFYTISDDGSKLYIDDKLIVDNDGGHSVRRAEGKVALEKGYHALHLLYFENYMGQELEVGFLGRDIPETPIPAEMLFLPD